MTDMVQQLGYIGFGVSDLEAWERFGTNVLGLEVTGKGDDGSFALRMDGHAQRFFIQPDASDDLIFVGWEVASEDALENCRKSLEGAGVSVSDGDAALCETRAAKKIITFTDPGGIPVEIAFGLARAAEPFSSKRVSSGFVADELGLGHLVISTRDRDESRDFYRNVLGFKLSDHITLDLHGYPVDIAFLHCNGRHHSLAMGGPMPKRMHHFMLEVNHMDDVGLAFDRAMDNKTPIAQMLGRHPNDKMFSFYAITPSGFQFEFGWGGRIIDDEVWEPTVYDHISEWGHRPFPKKRRPKPQPEAGA